VLTNRGLVERKNLSVTRGLSMATDIFVARGKNAEIWDVEGRRYIDFAAGIAVVNTGHCHPAILAAVAKQMQAFTHTCAQVVPYESYVSLAERLNTAIPGDFPKKSLFVTTGAEANESAIKVAKAYTGRSGVIAFAGGFHGRTQLMMALTGKVAPYKADFGPMAPDVFHVPYPSQLHGVSATDSLAMIEMLCRASIAPDRLAAIILEPVQGEGGFYIASPELMRGLRAFCDRHGVVLIADEIQTGFARTGKMFAMEHYDVAADIVTTAKGLGGGFPIAAVTGRAEIMDGVNPGGLGGTFGGSPIGLAAAHAVLDVIESENLCARAEEIGARIEARLEALKNIAPEIGDIRRLGSLVAVEFMDPATGAPRTDLVTAIKAEALKRGLVLLSCGAHGNVIRFLPPLTIEDEVLGEALDILADVLKDRVHD
jgi:4-aminobutyrate aminotransferase